MTSERVSMRYAGFIIVLSLILGGGTMQGLWTDRVIQVALIPALMLGFSQIDRSRWGLSAKWLALAVVALFAAQFLPLGRSWPSIQEPIASGVFLSAAAGRTMESLLVALPLMGFALFISRFTDTQQEQLIRFLLLGLLVNLGVGAFQLSASSSYASTFLPYEIRAGLFTNENHFSTLVFSLVPVFGYFYLYRTKRPLVFFGLVAISMLYLFAVGSRAGIGIALGLTAISFGLFSAWPRTRQARLLLLLSITLIAVAILLRQGAAGSEDHSRLQMAGTTLGALRDHWLIGTGIGSFENVYALYQDPASVTEFYVNHAHNDYLEFALETGIAGIAVLAIAIVLLLRGSRRTTMTMAFAISMAAIGVHSLVDYPLRSMAIGIVFALFAGHILVELHQPASASRRSDVVPEPRPGS
jgi:O-antigen ligase